MPAPVRMHVVVPVLLLAACAHQAPPRTVAVPPTPYAAPAPSQASALLTMRSQLEQGDFYTVNVFADAQACAGSRRVGVSQPGGELASTRLAAERWQTLEVVVAKPARRSTCTIRLSFAPRTGRSYLLSTHIVDGGCTARVLDATEADAPQLEATLRFRSSEHQACVPLAQAPTALPSPVPQHSVRPAELPIHPGDDALSPANAPRIARDAGQEPNVKVSDDDLKSLTGH